jgi:hypothetical protein
MRMVDRDLVNCAPESDADDLRRALEAEGFALFVLDGAGASDQTSFLAAVDRDLPTSAGLTASNWDALVDVVEDGLSRLPADRLALVWRHAESLELSNLQDFLTAIQCLTDIAARLQARQDGRHRQVLIFLLGSAPNYLAS